MNMVIKYDKIQLKEREGKPECKPARERKTMTNVYKCDKCGKLFNDYDEAYEHENSHWVIERYKTLVGHADIDSMTEYKEGQEEPNVVHMVFSRWNSEKAEYEYRCGKFKLVSSYEAPLEISND